MAEFEGKHPNYWFLFVLLGVLTGVEVWAANWDLEKKTLVLILVAFAVVKAGMVALYFMHLRFEWAKGKILYVIIGAPFILVLVFAFGLLPDIAGIVDYLPF